MSDAVFLDLDTLSRHDVDLTSLHQAIESWRYFGGTRPEATAERLQGAHVAVTNKVVIGRALMQANPGLKLIAIAATGTNNVDLDAARELGIAVSNVAGYSTPSVVQHVFAMILGLTTRLLPYRESIRTGAWERSAQFCLLDHPVRELRGLTLGIVGFGALGQAVAQVAECFGMRVLLAQRPGGEAQPGRIPLVELLPEVDVLSLHCPLTPATRNLVDAAALALMKPDALLINTARGGVVDEAALAEALRQGRLGGAGIDVLAEEPPRPGSPLLDPELPNLLLTPHTAWTSRESRQRLIHEIAANIRAFYNGESRNRVV